MGAELLTDFAFSALKSINQLTELVYSPSVPFREIRGQKSSGASESEDGRKKAQKVEFLQEVTERTETRENLRCLCFLL